MQSPGTHLITGEANGFPRPFGNYLLLAAFAQGGMGELFLAMNGSIAGAFRLCVVKKLRPDLTNDKEYVNRFIDEARVVAQLNHANISHVFDVGRIEGQYYLAMEYVSGVSVKRLMARATELDTTIPEDIAIFIAREVLEALDYAHQHTHPITGEPLNVVHRDVSPQNMLVSWSGEVKLIDFGLALSALKDEHTATGAVMGKVAYMPPEQARGDDVGPPCDQFATAVVTYEMMVGDRYHGDLPLHAIWAIAGMGNFPPPKWNKLSNELQTVLGQALHNDPFRRFKTCGDLREALGAYMAQRYPTTGERSLRDLLDKWFKEYRAQERELLVQFRDINGQAIREAVMATQTTAESLLSGPHARPVQPWQMAPPPNADQRAPTPTPMAFQMPPGMQPGVAPPPGAPMGTPPPGSMSALPSMLPTMAPPPQPQLLTPAPPGMASQSMPHAPAPPGSNSNAGLTVPATISGAFPPTIPSADQDWRAMISKSAPISPSPTALSFAKPGVSLPDARLDESRSLRLMPPPGGGSPGGAHEPMLEPIGPAGTPMSIVGESTAAFLKSAPGGNVNVATLQPRFVTGPTGRAEIVVGESTERFLREMPLGGPGIAPTQIAPLNAPQQQAQQQQPTFTPPTAPAIHTPLARPPQAAMPARADATDRIARRGVQGTSQASADDDDIALPKRNLWPLVAAGLAAVAVVAVIVAIVASSSSSSTPATTNPASTTVSTDPKPSNPTPVTEGATNPGATNASTPLNASNPPPTNTSTNSSSSNPHASQHASNTSSSSSKHTKDPKETHEAASASQESEAAKRARDRVDTLKRSACADPCVGRIVGQLESMPGAVELDGFRTSVDACIDACRH